ncbi:ABC transporter ATP-binding protein [Labrys monachus]|uniref:Peptide/nickel transport system ATP-binding protein n=1 Tax=Labrys monachus TaxID=217067 RepID=A0ABU0F9H9_9HYPH|nr:ATP-binding cassette domain-containing protein [Labrys monachus]MDQ0391273.1 peptide/nickel transport system ATP-binding protein [Labrys monachus]
MADGPLLAIRDLRCSFRQSGRRFEALAGVDLAIGRGEILGLAGGSGAGKTTLARAILRLIEPDSGSIAFDGVDLTALAGAALRRMRPRLQLVFQDPMAAFNPRARVEQVVGDPLRVQGSEAPKARRRRIEALLDSVGLPAGLMQRFPHELSGGQRQRVAIARALATDPALVVLDEPVSALDVSVRAQILNLLLDIRDRTGVAYLFIAHDLAVMAAFCDRLAVMEGGRIVEAGTPETLIALPQTATTRNLIAAVAPFRPSDRLHE